MAREFQQAPGGGQLWKVGNTHYLAYRVPESKPAVWMTWRIESSEQRKAVLGPGGDATPDRTLTKAEFRKIGALDFGGSKELVNYDSEPFDKLIRDYEVEAAAQPWLKDPEVLALVAGAILEGRSVTDSELSQTDFWQNHSQEEREWMRLRATDPQAARDKKADNRRAIARMLREAGVSEAPDALIDTLNDRFTAGVWSESFIQDQVRGIADPYAGVDLTSEVINAARGHDPSTGDTAALAGGRDAVRDRVRAMFENRGLEIGADASGGDRAALDAGEDAVRERVQAIFDNRGVTPDEGQVDRVALEVVGGRSFDDVRRSIARFAEGDVEETSEERLNRITDEVIGGRSLSDVRSSLDRQAGTQPLTGSDITRAGEDEVRKLLHDWLGPALARQYEGAWTREWAGKMRNDPDAQTELVEELRALRMGAFPEWTNENLRYVDVAPTAKQLFSQVWQQDPGEDDPLFMDILRMTGPGGDGVHAAASRLRREGLDRGVGAVTQGVAEGIVQATGGSVRQSVI